MIARVAITSLSLYLLAGCATSPPPAATLTPESAAAEFTARSLRDERLRAFLIENVGRDPGASAWDFEALCWVAFYYHPSLAVARAQWATARAAQATAATRANPTVSLAPGYNSTREPGLSPWFPAINFDFLFPTSGKRRSQRDLARAESEAARLGVLNTAWQVRAEVRHTLVDTAVAARRAEALRTHANAQRALVGLLEQRFKAGGATASELSNARAGLLRAEAAVADALSQSATARVHVASALGMPTSALEGFLIPAPSTAPIASRDALDTARQESLRSRTDILAALAKYHAAHAALELEVARQAPDFHLGPGYQWDQGANKWSLSVSFELPIFHRNEAPIAEATARRAEAAAQFTAVQAQALAAIDTAVAAQTAASLQVEHARQLADETTKQNARAQQRVTAGAADRLELQLAHVESASVAVLINEAESAAEAASVQLEDALQIPFPRLTNLADPAAAHAATSP